MSHNAAGRWSGPVAIAAALVIFIGVNLIAQVGLRDVRADLTENALHSLSPGTESVLREIDEPVRLRFFYSRRLGEEVPAYGVYAQRVRDLLDQYVAIADGGLRLEVIDPAPFSEEEDRAVAFGLQGVPVDQGGDVVYFGLVGTNAVDLVETIPFFQPDRESRLEYDLTQMVARLSERARPVVGVMTDLPVYGGAAASPFGGPQRSAPWVLFEQLDEQFETRPIPTDARVIDEDVRVLLLVHPQDLGDPTLYAIDQFVMRGGRLALFLDPLSEEQQAQAQTGAPDAPGSFRSDLPRLLARWGVAYDPAKGVGDALAARRVATREADARGRAGVDYFAWLALDRRNFGDDLVTAELQQMNVATAGAVALAAGASLTLEPLIATSPASMAFDIAILEDRPDPQALAEVFAPAGAPLVIAARLSGPLETAFPDGPPADEEGEEGGARPAHRASTDGPANLAIVADTDLLRDPFWVNAQNFFGQRLLLPVAQNASFVANLVESLSGSDALISLRSRAASYRPFTLIEDLRREAEERFRSEERALVAALEQTEEQLAGLRRGENGEAPILTEEQRVAIARFEADLLDTRAKLRDVQRNLRAEVERTETLVETVNIFGVPALVVLFAGALALLRARRRRAAVAGGRS